MLRGLPPEGVEDVPGHTVLEELLAEHLVLFPGEWVDVDTPRARRALHGVLQVARDIDGGRFDRPWVAHQRRLWQALAGMGHPGHILLPDSVLELDQPFGSEFGGGLREPVAVDPAILHVDLLEQEVEEVALRCAG